MVIFHSALSAKQILVSRVAPAEIAKLFGRAAVATPLVLLLAAALGEGLWEGRGEGGNFGAKGNAGESV